MKLIYNSVQIPEMYNSEFSKYVLFLEKKIFNDQKKYAITAFDVEASTITVETNVDSGLGYYLVNSIKENNYLITVTLQNNDYKISKKIIINMPLAYL